MGYKLLGFAVWRGAIWFVKKRYGWLVPSRRVATAGLVVVAVTGLGLAAARRDRLDA